jgi:hypothetical protein
MKRITTIAETHFRNVTIAGTDEWGDRRSVTYTNVTPEWARRCAAEARALGYGAVVTRTAA